MSFVLVSTPKQCGSNWSGPRQKLTTSCSCIFKKHTVPATAARAIHRLKTLYSHQNLFRHDVFLILADHISISSGLNDVFTVLWLHWQSVKLSHVEPNRPGLGLAEPQADRVIPLCYSLHTGAASCVQAHVSSTGTTTLRKARELKL